MALSQPPTSRSNCGTSDSSDTVTKTTKPLLVRSLARAHPGEPGSAPRISTASDLVDPMEKGLGVSSGLCKGGPA